VKALADPELRQRFAAEGATPVGSTPAEFASFYKAESEKWADVAQKSGTKLD
jgi:tripartite-type tricarboxylate transporter receptor subunit TctC